MDTSSTPSTFAISRDTSLSTTQKGESYQIICGDALEVLKTLPENSIQLVVTSPPYADQRKHTYGGIHPDQYVEWFLPIAKELFRVLAPTGTFVINIKEKAINGERSTYVLELILALRQQ